MGKDRQTGTLLSAQAPTMVGLAWAKPLLPTALQLPTGQVSNPHVRETDMCRMVYRVVHKVLEAPTLCNVSGARVGATWPGSVQLWQHHKQGRGGPKGMWSNPLQQSTISSKHSLCDPEPKWTQDKAVNKRGWKGIAPILFLNPDPLAQLVGHANKAPVVVDGHEVTALVDLGAQVSNISA